ncbi:hypothetical protein NDU88_007840 [Pleurodeles waltl]|uniref:Uncharacterized protein n=1 Tax=Pleurodeles waltl TaxID=8319 RepID=A0AAV7PQ67_PLEWA|nr:hypothetical protein NDU88_007840 [Pleurodeles waltl]
MPREAFKPVLCGTHISYCVSKQRRTMQDLAELESQIHYLEARNRQAGKEILRQQLGLLQEQYRQLLLREAKMAWQVTQSRIY